MGKSLLFVCLSLFIFSCNPTSIAPGAVDYKIDKPETVEFKQAKLETIVILGSSTASGVGATQYKYSWAGLLRNRLMAGQVINLAKGGYTTYHILADDTKRVSGRPAVDSLRNISAALERSPTTLIISMTTNDVANGFGIDEIMANLATIRAKAFAAGVKKVIITTPHPRKINAATTAKYILQRDQILKTYAATAVNIFDPVADSTSFFKAELLCADGIHPNDKGHDILFQHIKKALNL